MLCEKDEHGRVVLTPPGRPGEANVGDLRANVVRYCRRVGLREPHQIEAVYQRWKAREEASGGGERRDQQPA